MLPPERWLCSMRVQDRQVGLDRFALQRLVLEAQQVPRRLVGQHDPPVMVQREDGERAGFDQNANLHFGLLPEANLLFAFGQVLQQQAAPLVQLRHEESGHGESDYRHASLPSAPVDHSSGSKSSRSQPQAAASTTICSGLSTLAQSITGIR